MSTALARKFAVDVTADLTLASGWVALNGINDLDPEVTPNLEDASAYDTNGFSTSEVTMMSWTLAATFFRRQVANIYDAGQELVRARVGQFDQAARIGVRWYDKAGGPEANQGIAVIAWKRTNTAVKNLEQAQVTFTGTDIALQMGVTNPYNVSKAPVVLAATPGGQGTGTSVAVTGSGFTGATSVKFGGTNATSFAIVNDQLITAVLPSGAAGSAVVSVTTPNGTSNSLAYTRAA